MKNPSILQRVFIWLFYRTSWVVVQYLRLFGVLPMRVHGREQLPKKGAYVILANHWSDLPDQVIAVLALRRFTIFLAKAELWKSRWIAWVLDAAQAVPVYRETPAAATQSLESAVELLRRGHVVVFFGPGGSQLPNKPVTKYKTGAARAARAAGVPLFALAMTGTDTIRRPGAGLRASHPMSRTIADISGMVLPTDPRSVEAITADLKEWIELQVAGRTKELE